MRPRAVNFLTRCGSRLGRWAARSLRLGFAALAAWAMVGAAELPPGVTRPFDLPAGEAAEVLQAFVSLTGAQLVFPARAVAGIRTQPLRGDYAVPEALERLLAGTGLEVVHDRVANAFSVRRRAAPPPGDAKANSLPAARDAKAAADPPSPLPEVKVERRRDFGVTTHSILPTTRAAPLYHHVVTRAEIEQSGVTTMAEFLTTVPGYSGEGAESLQASADLSLTGGANVYGGSFLKLRGWDSQHTTVLVNGRELPPSPESRGPDLSRIPLAAVERIDVLPFAGSALYGDGAVGGAMNIILRRDFAGSSASLQLGDSTRGGGGEGFLTWVEGLASADGRTKATVIGDYQRRGALRLGDRDFLARAMSRLRPGELLAPAGARGTDRRALLSALVTGYPAMFVVNEAVSDLGIPGRSGADFALVPAGRHAATVPRAAFVETNPAALDEQRQSRVVVRRPTESFNFNVQLEHTLKPDALELYSEIGYSRASEAFSAPDQIEPLSLDLVDPRNPFRADVANGFVGRDVTLYFDPIDLPDARFRQARDSARVALGVRGAPDARWHWSLDSFADVSQARTTVDAYGASLNELLRRWTPATAANFGTIYDPFADHLTNPVAVATRERYLARSSWLDYRARTFGAEARVGGRGGDWAAGPLQFSIGAEYEWRDRVTRQKTEASRDLYVRLGALSAFEAVTRRSELSERGERIGAMVEGVVPLWRDHLRGLPLYAADLNLASRVAQTAGGHAAVSNLAALKVAPSRSWALRATWSQGYVAPSGALVNSPITETITTTSVVDPLRGKIRQLYPVRVVTGGGASIRPETSQAQVFGVLFTPVAVPGLFISIDVWSIGMRDRLRAPTVQELVSHADYFAGKIERDRPQLWELALGWAGPVSRVDLRPIHVTQLRSDGVDVSFRYRMAPTRVGTFTLSGQIETVRRYEEQFLPVTPAVDKVNVVADGTSDGLMDSAVVSPRTRATLGWMRQAWFASVTAAYTPHYHSETTTPTAALPAATGVDGEWIGSSLRWDLQAGYTVPRATQAARSWFSDTTWTLGVRNVFDRAPAPRSDGSSFYSRLDDPRMRFVYGRVQWRG